MTNDVLAGLMEEVRHAPDVGVVRDRYGYKLVRDGSEEYLRRVTTLLRGIPKDWLGNWAAKVVAEFAVEHLDKWKDLPATDAIKLLKGSPWSKRDDAGDRGTAIHNALEAYAKKQPVPRMTADETACADAAKRFLEARGSRTLAVELTVLNLSMGYAGTTDVWEIDTDGASWLLDWKTSADVYPEHAVQLAAYRNAEYAVVQKVANGKPGKAESWTGKLIPWDPTVAERLGVVHVTPERAVLHPVAYTDELWEIFCAAAKTKIWQLDTDTYGGRKPRKEVFGEPIPGPECSTEAPADTGEIPEEPEGQEAA